MYTAMILVLDRTTQLTNVPYGALDPQVSPDGSTLAFVSYQHEQYDLVNIPFDPDSAPEITLPLSAEARPIPALQEVPEDFEVEPYRLGGRLAPRMLVPMVSYSRESPDRELGLGGGFLLLGSDPLRKLTYTAQASFQAQRMWATASVSTYLGRVRTTAYVQRSPRTITAAVRDMEGQVSNVIYGRTQDKLGVQFRVPFYLASNVRSTNGAIRIGMEAGRESWFSVDDNAVPENAETGQSLAESVGYTAINPGAAFNFRQMRNTRDLWPNRGASISVSSHYDLSHGQSQARRAVLGRAELYWSPSRRANTGLRFGIGFLAQNRASVYDAHLIVPRTYEDALVDTGQLIKADVEFIQPLWFIDNGFLHLPLYFKALYTYGFMEAVMLSDTPELENARAVGAGFGLQLRVMHYIDLDLKIGLAIPESGSPTLTFK